MTYDEVKIRPCEVFAYYETATGHKMLKTARRFGLSVEKMEEFMLLFGKIAGRSHGPSIPRALLEKKLSQGKSHREIASDLGVSKSTVGYAVTYYGLAMPTKA